MPHLCTIFQVGSYQASIYARAHLTTFWTKTQVPVVSALEGFHCYLFVSGSGISAILMSGKYWMITVQKIGLLMHYNVCPGGVLIIARCHASSIGVCA